MAGNPKFTVLYEKMRGKTFELDRDVMSIGRRDGMDICIKEPSLSGHHADLIRGERDGKYYYTLRDNDSTNGTKINSVPVTEQELKNADLILFGNVEVLYDSNDDSDTGSESFATLTHTIDLSALDSGSAPAVGQVSNLNPFAALEKQKHVMVQKIMLIAAGVLGLAAAAAAAVVLFSILNKS